MIHSRLDLVFLASWVVVHLQDHFTQLTTFPVVFPCIKLCLCENLDQPQDLLFLDLQTKTGGVSVHWEEMQENPQLFHSLNPDFSRLLSVWNFWHDFREKGKPENGFSVCMTTEIHCWWWKDGFSLLTVISWIHHALGSCSTWSFWYVNRVHDLCAGALVVKTGEFVFADQLGAQLQVVDASMYWIYIT